MRIAKPLLLVATPIGVAIGVFEAFRLVGGLAVVPVIMLTVVSAAIGSLVMIARRERAEAEQAAQEANRAASAEGEPGVGNEH